MPPCFASMVAGRLRNGHRSERAQKAGSTENPVRNLPENKPNMNDVESSKRELCEYARLAYRRGLVSGTGGNVSLRIDDGTGFLITPSAVSFREITAEQVITVDGSGRKTDGAGQYRPSKETILHLIIYEHYSDVGAVVHVHPPYCTGLSLSKADLPRVTVTAKRNLSPALIVPEAPPGSEMLAEYTKQGIQAAESRPSLILLTGHGIIAIDENLEAAFNTAELAEETAKVAFIAQMTGQ